MKNQPVMNHLKNKGFWQINMNGFLSNDKTRGMFVHLCANAAQWRRWMMDDGQKSYAIPPSALMVLAKYTTALDADLRMTQRFYTLTFASIFSPSLTKGTAGSIAYSHWLCVCWTKHSPAGRLIVQRSAPAADEGQPANWVGDWVEMGAWILHTHRCMVSVGLLHSFTCMQCKLFHLVINVTSQ